MRDKLARLYLDAIDGPDGRMFAADASDLMRHKEVRAGSVDLIVTSPPYLQVVNYGTANWIRLWLLGVDEVGRERGEGRIKLDGVLDHRHNYQSYKEFMLRTLQGTQRVLHRDGVAAVVIGKNFTAVSKVTGGAGSSVRVTGVASTALHLKITESAHAKAGAATLVIVFKNGKSVRVDYRVSKQI